MGKNHSRDIPKFYQTNEFKQFIKNQKVNSQFYLNNKTQSLIQVYTTSYKEQGNLESGNRIIIIYVYDTDKSQWIATYSIRGIASLEDQKIHYTSKCIGFNPNYEESMIFALGGSCIYDIHRNICYSVINTEYKNKDSNQYRYTQ